MRGQSNCTRTSNIAIRLILFLLSRLFLYSLDPLAILNPPNEGSDANTNDHSEVDFAYMLYLQVPCDFFFFRPIYDF